MNNTIKAFKELGEKYGFPVIEANNLVILTAKNLDGNPVKWISYNSENDTVSYLGNTDNCNIWLGDTRKDFSPEKTIQFIKDLNEVFEFEDGDKFLVKQLIDPEDWQIIADISDAYEDLRYKL